MHVVRRGDVDRVEVLLLVEQLAPVLVDRHVGEQLLDVGRAGEVHVGHRDQLEVLAGGQRLDVGKGLAVGPETGVVNRLARSGAGGGAIGERGGQPDRRQALQSGSAADS